jgi:hypothetical protein
LRVFELYDTTTRNIVGLFHSEIEAIRFVRKWPRDSWQRLVLGAEDEEGAYRVVLRGNELIAAASLVRQLVAHAAGAGALAVYGEVDQQPVQWVFGALANAARRRLELLGANSASGTARNTAETPPPVMLPSGMTA